MHLLNGPSLLNYLSYWIEGLEFRLGMSPNEVSLTGVIIAGTHIPVASNLCLPVARI